MDNQFFIWQHFEPSPVAFDPAEFRRTQPPGDSHYFCEILLELNRRLPSAGITFLLTWNLDSFDDRFEDAVVLLIGDEMYQTPSYAGKTRAVLKTGGIRPNQLSSTLALPPSLTWRVMLRDLRNAMVAIRRKVKTNVPPRANVKVFEMPLGTYRLVDTPDVPFQDRTTDVFFAGSVPTMAKRTMRASVKARYQLADALKAAQAKLPELKYDFALTLRDEMPLSPEEYSQRVRNSKIMPCPRGNFDETFRIFEAAKAGCVIVAEPFPSRWYYENAPVVQIRGWSDFPQTLADLHKQPDKLLDLSNKTRLWWQDRLSESAVATYMQSRIAIPKSAPASPAVRS
jgi:hypothetical protein